MRYDTFDVSGPSAADWLRVAADLAKEPCDDKSLGVIAPVHARYGFAEQTDFDYQPISPHGPDRRLILVLESPHVDEYRKDLRGPTPAPAKGRTGLSIRRQLGSLLEFVRPRLCEPLELLLVNAVQYQCSRGQLLTCYRSKVNRDRIFRHFFGTQPKATGKEFRSRMSGYVKEGDVVINCCTAGVTKKPLRDLVTISLVKMREEIGFSLLCAAHPAARFNQWGKGFRKDDLLGQTTAQEFSQEQGSPQN